MSLVRTYGGERAAWGTGADTRRLRVAFVHLSDFHVDGEVQRPARALAARGDEVHSVGVSRSGAFEEGEGTIVVHDAGVRRSRGGARAYLREYGAFLARATAIVTRLHAREPLDLVQVHNMPDALVFAGIAPKLAGRPVVLQLNDTFPELFESLTGRGPGSAMGRLVRLEERLSAAMADRLVAVTPAARACFTARGVGAGKTVVMFNAPSEAVFGSPRPPRVDFDPRAVRLVYHGGLPPRYGVDVALAALPIIRRDLPEATLDVYSHMADGPEAEALRAQAPPGATVHPCAVDHRHIPALLERADIGLVPTLVDDFTRMLLPVKLMEYVHMGMPVVASDLPLVREAFGSDGLALVTPGDPRAIAAAVCAVARDPDAAAARARLATQRLAPLSWNAQVARYTALVDELVSRSPRRLAVRRPRWIAGAR